jgi:hypothetical protein
VLQARQQLNFQAPSSTIEHDPHGFDQREGEEIVMNPLDSITGTIVSGFVLAIILAYVVKAIAGA